VYHVLNRANARMRIFDKPHDYEAFERILQQAVRRVRMRLLAYCVMPNHWHLVLWPREDGDLSPFVAWLTLTHTQRWHAHRHSVGSGHVYQGRFKSFLVESDEHLWTVCRYVERNALRAGLCVPAEQWRWSSVWRRESGDAECRAVLCQWPIVMPKDWLRRLNLTGEPARVGGVASVCEPKSALRKRRMGRSCNEAVRSEVGVSAPRPSPQGIAQQWFLTPFLSFLSPGGGVPQMRQPAHKPLRARSRNQ
jgi:putative transposase